MTKCLSCGHFRHDLELNCPKCGSFYSTIVDDFEGESLEPPNETKTNKPHLNTPKHRLLAVLVVILLLIAMLFL